MTPGVCARAESLNCAPETDHTQSTNWDLRTLKQTGHEKHPKHTKNHHTAGHLVAQQVERLPSVPVMVLRSQNQAPHRALLSGESAGGLLVPRPLLLPLPISNK